MKGENDAPTTVTYLVDVKIIFVSYVLNVPYCIRLWKIHVF